MGRTYRKEQIVPDRSLLAAMRPGGDDDADTIEEEGDFDDEGEDDEYEDDEEDDDEGGEEEGDEEEDEDEGAAED